MKRTFTLQSLKRNVVNRVGATALLTMMLAVQAKAQVIYGTVSNTLLVSFNASTPGTITSSVAISGITVGQTIEGLDFRPNTGQLYALGYNKLSTLYQLYTINVSTGAASAINTATTMALGNGPVGFDFNPTVDRIRVISANGGNFRLHPGTGLIAATDGTLAYTAGDPNAAVVPQIVAGAYVNSYIGAATTALYNYDYKLNVVTLQNPPNNGSLTTVGVSGITTNTTTPMVDMDVFYDNTAAINKAYLVANTSGTVTVDELYTLNVSTGAVTLVGAIGAMDPVSNIAVFIDRTTPTLTGQMAYGLSGTNLISFDTQNPSYIRTINAITGVTAGQALVGMDFRPANNILYALGYNSTTNDAQLYTINTSSAIATVVNSTPISIMVGTVSVGMDFNPTVDRIRVVSNNDANYRLEPVTGTISATDANLNFATTDVNTGVNPNAGTVAYTNSYSTATMTTLYNYEEALNVLTTQAPPNNGTLNTIGSTGITVNPADPTVDMDIFYDAATMTNMAFLAANTGTATIDQLYSVNLSTGATTVIGKIGYGIPVRDIAIQTVASLPTAIFESENKMGDFVSVYPNPLKDQATISIKYDEKASVSIIDISGRIIDVVYNSEINGDLTLIHWNTEKLDRGLYFIHVSFSNGMKQTIKVVK